MFLMAKQNNSTTELEVNCLSVATWLSKNGGSNTRGYFTALGKSEVEPSADVDR